MNSIERPAAYEVLYATRAPSTLSRPAATVATPPLDVCTQFEDNVEPENGSSITGLRITSPSPMSVTTEHVPTVPALNCAAVVSPRPPDATVIVTIASF